jgi:hypothetical protein
MPWPYRGGPLDPAQVLERAHDGEGEMHAETGDREVVAAPARRQLGSDVRVVDRFREKALDGCVDVLVFQRRPLVELRLHGVECSEDALELRRREDAHALELASVSAVDENVLAPEPSIEIDGSGESVELGGRRLAH